MPTKHERAQITSQYIGDLVKRRALAAIAKHDATLSKQYEKVADSIRKKLRAMGYSVKEVADIIRDAFSETLEERVRIVADEIRDAAREGRKLDQETFDAVFGPSAEAGGDAPRPLAAPSSARPKRLSGRRPNVSEDE